MGKAGGRRETTTIPMTGQHTRTRSGLGLPSCTVKTPTLPHSGYPEGHHLAYEKNCMGRHLTMCGKTRGLLKGEKYAEYPSRLARASQHFSTRALPYNVIIFIL